MFNLIVKYKATSYTALLDLCTPEEWQSVLTSVNNHHLLVSQINTNISLYIKYRLTVEREDRFSHLINCAQNGTGNSRNTISRIFITNNIVPDDFVRNLKKVLNCKEPKINCLFLVGPSNSGKSFIAQSIASHFITGYASSANSLSEFSYENFLNKSLILMEEPFVTEGTCDDLKNIFAGANIQVGKKYLPKQDLYRTPVIMTGNHEKLGKGYLNPKDEDAFQNRMITYNFNEPFVTSEYISPEQVADWICFIYNRI